MADPNATVLDTVTTGQLASRGNYGLFEKLLAFSWQSTSPNSVAIQFPITQMTVELNQDLATHSVWGQDAERQEATGRKSLVFTAHIPFYNTIAPGKTETWAKALYPDTFRDFFKATADRATGILNHPEFGQVLCKVRSVRTSWSATSRAGCDVEATWVETLLPESKDINKNPSPIQNAKAGALNLDATIRRLAIDGRPDHEPNFLDILDDIAKVGDEVTLLQYQGAGKINNVLARLDGVERSLSFPIASSRESLSRTKSTLKNLGDDGLSPKDIVAPDNRNAALAALAWPGRDAINRMRSSMADLRQKLLESGKPITLYTVQRASTLAGIVAATGADLRQVMALNPDLVKGPVVPAGSIVRYYAAAET